MKRLSYFIAVFFFLVLTVALLRANSGFAGTKFVTIGTGGVTGVYYPTGGAIAKMMNKRRKEYGLKVTAEATGGSVFNINALITGDMDLALAQSDRAAQAWKGIAEWKGRGPQKSLRGVFALHHETICLIAAVNSGIKQCSDLKGKIVAIGNPGSGTRQNSIDALSLCGLTTGDLGNAEGLKAAEAAGLLQDGRLDAYFYTVGHPNGSIKEAAAGTTKVRFIPFNNVEPLLKRKPFYTKAVIPVKMYPGVENDKDVPTFGLRATMLSSEKTPDNVVYAIVKTVFDNFDTFKTLHPAFANLKKEEMVKDLPIPLHPGAIKYYKEVGLLK